MIHLRDVKYLFNPSMLYWHLLLASVWIISSFKLTLTPLSLSCLRALPKMSSYLKSTLHIAEKYKVWIPVVNVGDMQSFCGLFSRAVCPQRKSKTVNCGQSVVYWELGVWQITWGLNNRPNSRKAFIHSGITNLSCPPSTLYPLCLCVLTRPAVKDG